MQPSEKPIQDQANTLANKLIYCLTQKQRRVQDKYDYYDADNDIPDFGISTPMRMRNIRPGIGWAGRAVHTLADRVSFDGFANDTFGVNEYMDKIGGVSVFNQVKNDAFIAGCAFIAIADAPLGSATPKVLVPFTALEATGEVDQRTGLLKWGLVVTKWHEPKPKKPGINFAPKDYILFTPQFTAIYTNRVLSEIVPNETGRTLLHAITHRSSANRPLGKSRITNTVRRIINEVGRLKRREEIAEEFYALPQRYITGLAEGVEKDPKMDSAIGLVWAINVDDDGNKPEIGQLAQMSIEGFVNAKKDKARDFCAETALTLRNLGYETGNPTSAESLTAMSDDLLLEAENAQESMGKQFKEIAITLSMARSGTDIVADNLQAIIPSWKPIFPVDVGAVGDAIYKIAQVMPEFIGTPESYKMMGIGIRQAEALVQRRLKTGGGGGFMNNPDTGGGTT